nr:Chain B, NUCLEOLAR RNA HELICASE 2 [Mus musculus]3ZIN_C Chain C, NUCLEOLAR RNA HELICASE 2 [Mus musculus]
SRGQKRSFSKAFGQ